MLVQQHLVKQNVGRDSTLHHSKTSKVDLDLEQSLIIAQNSTAKYHRRLSYHPDNNHDNDSHRNRIQVNLALRLCHH